MGGLPWAGGGGLPPEEESKEKLLDRLHQHTQHCPSCSAALARARTGQRAGLGLAAAATAAAAWLPGTPPALSAAVALGGVALAGLASWVEPLFVFKDYFHAER